MSGKNRVLKQEAKRREWRVETLGDVAAASAPAPAAMQPLFLLALLLLAASAVHAAVLGLDFGSSTYKLAAIRGGGIEVVLNDVSKRKTPTAIAFHPREGALYGDAALSFVRSAQVAPA